MPKQVDPSIPDWRLIHNGSANSITECNAGVLVGYENNAIACWDERQKDPIFNTSVGKRGTSVTSVKTVSTDLFAVGDSYGHVALWDLRNVHSFYKIVLPESEQRIGVSSIDLSNDSKLLAILRTNSTLSVVELESQKQITRKVKRMNSFYNTCKFDPSGRYIVTGSTAGSLHVIDISNENEDGDIELYCHEAMASCVDWCPNGNYLISCSDDKTTQLWELRYYDSTDTSFFLRKPNFVELPKPIKRVTRTITLHHYLKTEK